MYGSLLICHNYPKSTARVCGIGQEQVEWWFLLAVHSVNLDCQNLYFVARGVYCD